MKPALLFSVIFFSLFSSISAQYNFDTLAVRQISDNITHYWVKEYSVPWNLNVIKIDLEDPDYLIETVKAEDNISGYETTSSMAARNSYDGHYVVGAVNGDFYGGGGVPTNAQILQGEILREPINREVLGFDMFNNPMIDIVNFSGEVITEVASTEINGVNRTRNADEIILYNKYFGETTGTNAFGSEVLINPINGWIVNDTVKAIIEKKIESGGDMEIEEGKAVLSGHGASISYINNLEIGDTVKLALQMRPGLNKLKELVGGNSKFVNNGENKGDWPERHPRTAAGFSADSSTFYLVVVDGRQWDLSMGMTLTELADFLIGFGVYNAVNLDGGGSSTMVVWDDVVNSPSDGGERAVANSLLFVNTLPKGDLNSIQVMPQTFRVFREEAFSFEVSSWDENFNKLEIDKSKLKFSVNNEFGTVDNNGKFKAGLNADTGLVFIEYEGLLDTAQVIVKSVDRLAIKPEASLIDTFSTIAFDVDAFDFDNIRHDLDLNEFSWSLSDDSFGAISEDGVFKASKAGEVGIIVSFGDARDTSTILIEINEGEKILDPMESLSGWVLVEENLDTISSISIDNENYSQGSGSLALDYEFVYNNTTPPRAILETDIPVKGVPASITADVLSDGEDHHISYLILDADNDLFNVTTNQYSNITDYFDTVRAAITRTVALSPPSFLNYPITIKEIQIKMGSGKVNGETYSGSINIDNLRIEYPANVTSVEEPENIPSGFYLKQNFPNPFNPSTTIEFNVSETAFITLKIYDALGREVETLISDEVSPGLHSVKWNAGTAASGVYFYQIVKDGIRITKKMLMLK